jgi:hypothetical protein
MKIKRIKEFSIKENLSYSGEDVTKMPIIGKVITHPIGPFDEGEYDVVEIIDAPDGKDIYVCNKWYKEYKRIPQIIHSDLVKEYIPVAKFGNFY